jgi:dimethylhistidine N-methyltransferase
MMVSDFSARCAFYDLHPQTASFLAEVVDGLSRPNKEVPAKFFYDARGCELFDRICEQPEYYLTRTELDILARNAGQMADLLGERCLLIEYGSGNSRKTRVLLDRLGPAAYMPIDIAREQLTHSSAALLDDYPQLKVIAVCADYSRPLRLPDCEAYEPCRRVVFFPGSTIGNLTPKDAMDFLRNVARQVGPGGTMLVGVDLKKEAATLNAAYNDGGGVTAAFNLNLLARINRELKADFDLDAFRHSAFYNERLGRVEMHLVSLRDQWVKVGEDVTHFWDGETIHTENSYKYTVEEFQGLSTGAGFEPRAVWTDEQMRFSVHCLRVPV